MKGIVFSEFQEFVEQRFSPDDYDWIVEQNELSTGGAYTAVGTYDHHEFISLAQSLSARVDLSVADLVFEFGRYLFNRFYELYPELFYESTSAFGLLSKVEGYIHVEVKKLYPDAELPQLRTEYASETTLSIRYISSRPFAGLAAGLISACIDFFDEEITVKRVPDVENNNVLFTLTKAAVKV